MRPAYVKVAGTSTQDSLLQPGVRAAASSAARNKHGICIQMFPLGMYYGDTPRGSIPS